MHRQESIEMNLRKVTLAILVRALLAVALSPFRWLFDWVYTEKPEIWLTPGGIGSNDSDLLEQWDAIHDMFHTLGGTNTARETIATAIERGLSPISMMALALKWHVEQANGTKTGQSPFIDNEPPSIDDGEFPEPEDSADVVITATQALISLGYTKTASKDAINQALALIGVSNTAEQLIRTALKRTKDV